MMVPFPISLKALSVRSCVQSECRFCRTWQGCTIGDRKVLEVQGTFLVEYWSDSLPGQSCVKIFFVSKYLQSFWIARFAGGARRRISGDEVKTRGFIMDIDDGDSSLRCSGIKRVTEVQKSSRKRGKGFRCITDQMLCESHSSEENFQELRKESRKSTQVIEEKPARMEEESRSASSKFWQKDVMARQIPKERFAMIWYAAFEEEVEKGLLSALRATGGIREHSSAVRKLHVSMKRGMEETFPSRVADAGTRYWWEYTASEVFFKVMVSMLESSKDSCSRISNRLFIFFTDVIQLSGGYLRNAATRSGLRALTLKQENAVGALIECRRETALEIAKEFLFLCQLRTERNVAGHCFSSCFTPETVEAVLACMRMFIEEGYTQNFSTVATVCAAILER